MPLSDKTERPRDIRYVLKRLWSYLMKYKLWLLAALALNALGNLFSLIGPVLSGAAIDAINPGGTDFAAVGKYVIMMIVFYVLSSAMSYLLSALMIHIGRKITYAMRQDAFDSLASLPVNYFDQSYAGSIISKLSYDIDTVNTSLSSDLIQIFTSAITIVGAFVMMLTISPIMVSVFVVTIPLSVMVTGYITKKVHPLFKRRSAAGAMRTRRKKFSAMFFHCWSFPRRRFLRSAIFCAGPYCFCLGPAKNPLPTPIRICAYIYWVRLFPCCRPG